LRQAEVRILDEPRIELVHLIHGNAAGLFAHPQMAARALSSVHKGCPIATKTFYPPSTCENIRMCLNKSCKTHQEVINKMERAVFTKLLQLRNDFPGRSL
jgi:hypothetical protein